VASTDQQPHLTVQKASEVFDVRYETLRKRARRYLSDDPATALVVFEDSGDRGGKDRLLISLELLTEWYPVDPPTEPASVDEATRTEFDHLRTAHELSTQTARHLEIQLHAKELDERDARIADLEQQVESLQAEKIELHAMLVEALNRYVR